MQIPRTSFAKYQVPIYLYIIGIFALSSIPPGSIPKFESRIPIDKVVHFIEYGIFGFLLLRMISSFRRVPLIWSVVLAIYFTAVLGAVDESYQHLTKRSPDIRDWLTDITGATISVCFAAILMKIRKPTKVK